MPGSPFYFEPPVRLGNARVFPGARMLAHSYINSGKINGGTYIGRYCSIGDNVTLGTGHHDMSQLSTSSWFNLDVPPTVKHIGNDITVRVVIKNDVWIGDGVIVMNGVTIGNGAVIGAGAVVTKDVPDYAVVAGVPAKLIRMRFDDDIVARLQALKWWELDDEILKEHPLRGIVTSLSYLEGLPATARTRVQLDLHRV